MASSVIQNTGVCSVQCSKMISIPENSYVDIYLTEFIPAGKELIGISTIRIGGYVFPYVVNNLVETWIESLDLLNKRIRIKNDTTAWNNYTLNLIAFYK